MSFEVVYNQSDFDYRRAEGVNQSSLKKILVSPAHYQVALNEKHIKTPAMALGTATHALLLDGRKAFDGGYVNKAVEKVDLNVAELKEALDKKGVGYRKSSKKAELEALLYPDGKPVDRRTALSKDDYEAVEGMAASLQRVSYFDPGQEDYIRHNEVSVYFTWEGVECKARFDRVDFERKVLLDVKTTDSIEVERFAWKSVDLGYIFQAGFYTKAAEVAFGGKWGFEFAAVEKKAPYIADIFESEADFLEEGRNQCVKALLRYKACMKSGDWPAPGVRIRKLSLPSGYRPVTMEESTVEEDIF